MIKFIAALKKIDINKEDDNKLTLIFDNQQINAIIQIPQTTELEVIIKPRKSKQMEHE